MERLRACIDKSFTGSQTQFLLKISSGKKQGQYPNFKSRAGKLTDNVTNITFDWIYNIIIIEIWSKD